jgi:hypothetical protein
LNTALGATADAGAFDAAQAAGGGDLQQLGVAAARGLARFRRDGPQVAHLRGGPGIGAGLDGAQQHGLGLSVRREAEAFGLAGPECDRRPRSDP